MTRNEKSELIRQLAALPAFANCSPRDLGDLAVNGRHSSVPADWPIIQEDTPADACYVILQGTATVAVAGNPVATLEAGSIVGEVGVATGRLRNATVTSASPLELVHVDASAFTSLLQRRPALREALLARMNAVAATS